MRDTGDRCRCGAVGAVRWSDTREAECASCAMTAWREAIKDCPITKLLDERANRTEAERPGEGKTER